MKQHYKGLVKRGEVYLVNFDPTIGAEIQKTRPALILQNNILNRHSPVTIVAAISSKVDKRSYPTEVHLTEGEGGLEVESIVLLNQIRSIDKRRLIKKFGVLRSNTLKQVENALQICLGLIEI